MSEDAVVFDAADLTWTDGPLRNTKLIVGDFAIRIGEDGTELLVDDDAVVLDLVDSPVEEASGEGYARRSIDWTATTAQSGMPFTWSDVPVDEGDDCLVCEGTGLLPASDPSLDPFCSCPAGQRLRADEDRWGDWRTQP